MESKIIFFPFHVYCNYRLNPEIFWTHTSQFSSCPTITCSCGHACARTH